MNIIIKHLTLPNGDVLENIDFGSKFRLGYKFWDYLGHIYNCFEVVEISADDKCIQRHNGYECIFIDNASLEEADPNQEEIEAGFNE